MRTRSSRGLPSRGSLVLLIALAVAGCGQGGDRSGTCSDPVDLGVGGTFTGRTDDTGSDHRGLCMGNDGPEAVHVLEIFHESRVELSTHGTSFDSVLYIRQGSCTGPELGCDHNSGTDLDAYLDLVLEPGTYYVFVDGYSEWEHGFYSLDVHITMI